MRSARELQEPEQVRWGAEMKIVVRSLPFLALALAGCATTDTTPVVTDTFCLTARKRSWDPDVDSIQTMREAVTHNRFIDRRCPPKA